MIRCNSPSAPWQGSEAKLSRDANQKQLMPLSALFFCRPTNAITRWSILHDYFFFVLVCTLLCMLIAWYASRLNNIHTKPLFGLLCCNKGLFDSTGKKMLCHGAKGEADTVRVWKYPSARDSNFLMSFTWTRAEHNKNANLKSPHTSNRATTGSLILLSQQRVFGLCHVRLLATRLLIQNRCMTCCQHPDMVHWLMIHNWPFLTSCQLTVHEGTLHDPDAKS